MSELAKALAAAQAEMHNPVFDSQNPHFKNRYASLASVRNAVVPLLAKHGIAVIQDLQTDIETRSVCCYTHLLHASGEIRTFGPLSLPATKFDPQGMGSASTYARRYHLQAVAGVVGDEDDDANEASRPQKADLKITPTTGAWEAMDEESKAFLQSVANEVIAIINGGDIVAAYDRLNSEVLTTEEKVAVWTRFDSKQRSALKKQGETRKVA